MEDNSGDANEYVTLGMAFSRKYIKGTIVGIVISISFQFSAINLISSYIFPFFDEININATNGSVLYGAAGLLAALASPFLFGLVTCLTVRRGFIMAFALLTVDFLALIASIHFNSNAGSLATILIFAVIVEGIMAPLYWLHLPEITSGAILSLSFSLMYFLALVTSTAGPYLLKNSSEDQITFLVIAVGCFLCTLFYFFFLKSTDGLTDTQKRNLYVRREE